MATSAQGSQSYVALIKQVPATPRELPVTPVMQKVNFVSDDMCVQVTTKKSAHIRSDRMVSDLISTGISTNGGYAFEFQFENSLLDELLAAFLWTEAWSNIGAAAVVAAEGGVIVAGVLDMSAASETFTNFVDGQFIKLKGTAGDGIYQLFETGTNTYSVTPDPGDVAVFPGGATAEGSMIRNGVFYQPFFIERGHTDVTKFFRFLGMTANEFALNLADQSEVTGSFSFVGLESSIEDAIVSGATYTPPTSNQIFSTATHLSFVRLDGVNQGGCLIKDMDFTANNNVDDKTGHGVYGACSAAAKQLEVGGKITMYFEDETMQERLQNGTPFALSFCLEAESGHGYVFTFPRCKLSGNTVNVTGVDDDVMNDAEFESLADPVTSCAIQIDKFSS